MPLTTLRLAAIGFAVITTLSACGSEVTAGQATTAPSSSASADADVYEQLADARKPIACSATFANTLSAAFSANLPVMRTNVDKFAALVKTWDQALTDIEFPADAEPTVGRLRELNATELTDLDALAALPDGAQPLVLIDQANLVNFDELSVVVAVDELGAALGHPTAETVKASDELELAYATFYKDIAGVWNTFGQAVQANDLAGAKAANAVEEQAAQRFIDTLGGITWPAGYDERVATLRDALGGIIEFDRRQVDVPTVADIVQAPPQGSEESRRFEAAMAALKVSLDSDADKAGDGPKC